MAEINDLISLGHVKGPRKEPQSQISESQVPKTLPALSRSACGVSIGLSQDKPLVNLHSIGPQHRLTFQTPSLMAFSAAFGSFPFEADPFLFLSGQTILLRHKGAGPYPNHRHHNFVKNC